MSIPEIVNLVQIIGFPVIILQIFYAIIIYRDDHERSRRENAVKYLSSFTQTFDRKSSIARKLIELFDKEQCLSLSKQESIRIDKKYIEEVKAVFGVSTTRLTISGNDIQISEEQSANLRWLAMTYLNSLETLLLAWRHNVADRKMIEEECENLVDDRQGYSILETLREVFGKEACPGIDEFVMATRAKRMVQPGRNKLG